ncbi:MAG: 6-phosphofructokinase [Bacteroidetes bacterium]|nr:6-phosphofructokinase [Bacteroidota bacterium]
MKIGILTSGGDCPGLNAVIRAIVRKASLHNYTTMGIYNGWKGLFDEHYRELDTKGIAGIINRGGTILGTSRFNPFTQQHGKETLLHKVAKDEFDALIAIGGEGSMHIAQQAYELGINVIGVPKTIDNDISGTDVTFGFDTAVTVATEAIDRLHTTAESHHRIMILEVMGRHAGWIALHSGIAGGADIILLPEFKMSINEVIEIIMKRYSRGKLFSIIVIAEGADYIADEMIAMDKERLGNIKYDDFGRKRLGGIGNLLAEVVEEKSGFETRATILGYVQRGGVPTAYDRMLGTRLGIHAVEMVTEKKFGRMSALRGSEIVDIPIADAIKVLKTVPPELYEEAKVFFN